MLEHLFGSKTRVKLLKLFFMKPEQIFFVRELSRVVGVQINAVRRELELLLAIGLIKEAQAANKTPDEEIETGASLRRYYKLNPESIIHGELHALLLKEKIVGEQEFVKELEKKIGDVKLLLLTGMFTGDRRAQTDLLVVGNVKERALALMIQKYEKNFGFDIRYTALTESEFFDRRYVMDKFLYSLFEGPHLKVVNKLDI